MASKFVIELNASYSFKISQSLRYNVWLNQFDMQIFYWILSFESCFEKLSQQKGFCIGHDMNLFFSVLKTKVSRDSMSLHNKSTINMDEFNHFMPFYWTHLCTNSM